MATAVTFFSHREKHSLAIATAASRPSADTVWVCDSVPSGLFTLSRTENFPPPRSLTSTTQIGSFSTARLFMNQSRYLAHMAHVRSLFPGLYPLNPGLGATSCRCPDAG